MRISHLCVNYGAPLFQELFDAIGKSDIEQIVFYPRNRNHRLPKSNSRHEVFSPLVLSLQTKISFRRKRRILQKHFEPIFNAYKPDIIHAHTLFSDGALANHFYQTQGTPFIVALRSTDFEYFLKYKPWLKKHGQKIVENARYIVFISPSLKRRFQQVYGHAYEAKSKIIPNGIHASFLSGDAFSKKNFHSPLELLYVGSFLTRKNVPSLIKLLNDYPAKLTIVGSGGPKEKKVLQMIRDSANIKYLGQIKDPFRLIEVYRQSDVFIMTSSGETFGLVYIEAMSQGLPLIYSKGTGIDGFFDPGSVGYAVSPKSVDEVTSSLDQIKKNYPEISNNCRKQARQFNWTTIAEKYLDIYRSFF